MTLLKIDVYSTPLIATFIQCMYTLQNVANCGTMKRVPAPVHAHALCFKNCVATGYSNINFDLNCDSSAFKLLNVFVELYTSWYQQPDNKMIQIVTSRKFQNG